MKSPTTKLRKPKAVRLRWKLSVSRSRSPSGFRHHDRQPRRQRLGQRALRLARREEQPRDPSLGIEQPLGQADVDEQRVGRQALARHHLRQVGRATPAARRVRCREDAVGWHDELDETAVALADRHRLGLRRQGHGVDADDPDGRAAHAGRSFQHRRGDPPRAPQRDVVGAREAPPIGPDHGGERIPGDHRSGAGVACTRLAVQRLDPRPERGRKREPDGERRELHRVPPPVRQQGGKQRPRDGAVPT
jgi:hypothetical protein